MLRGYKCQKKSAVEILTTLGFKPAKHRGYILERTAGITPQKPCRLHGIINIEPDGTEYIDLHADYIVIIAGRPMHKSKRDYRVRRFVKLFAQIDHGRMCMAGHKLLAHYGDLRVAMRNYPHRHQKKYEER